jgi:hypothetical protein
MLDFYNHLQEPVNVHQDLLQFPISLPVAHVQQTVTFVHPHHNVLLVNLNLPYYPMEDVPLSVNKDNIFLMSLIHHHHHHHHHHHLLLHQIIAQLIIIQTLTHQVILHLIFKQIHHQKEFYNHVLLAHQFVEAVLLPPFVNHVLMDIH